MLKYSWSVEKNVQLRADSDRRVCFEDIVAAIESGGLLDDIEQKFHEFQLLFRSSLDL